MERSERIGRMAVGDDGVSAAVAGTRGARSLAARFAGQRQGGGRWLQPVTLRG